MSLVRFPIRAYSERIKMKIRSLSAFPCQFVSASLSSVLGMGLVIGTAFLEPMVSAAENSTNRLVTYKDEGRIHFALSLLATKDLTPVGSPLVAVVVDTSASQSGDFRADSMEVAQSIVEALPENAVVTLLACDVEPIVLSQATSPTSDSIVAGFKTLQKRIPLGATDLAGALRAARRELGDKPDASIVFIGDGFHLTNLLNTAEFESLIDDLRESRTSIHSLAIGPRIDCELLAVFASHTGGNVLVRENIVNATCQQIGSELAKATLSPVYWPSAASWPKGITNVLPGKLPPLRLDRDTIILGDLNSESLAGKLTMEGTVFGKAVSMGWDLKSEPSNPDFAFLSQVISKATPNSGLLMPVPGSDALRELGLLMANTSEQLVKDARFALNSGDLDAAVNIAQEALKRSPDNLSAKNILEAVEQSRKTSKPVKKSSLQGGSSRGVVKFVSAQIGDDPFVQPPRSSAGGDSPFGEDPPPVNATQIPSAPGDLGTSSASSDPFGELANASDLLSEDEGQRRVAAQQLEALVRSELGEAKRSRDPGSTKISLKALQDQIRRAPELDAGGRARLESQVASAIQTAARAEATKKEEYARIEAVQSNQSATKRLLTETDRRDSTVQQLVERYNSLMAQQLYAAANNEIAPQITAVNRDTVIDVVTNLESNLAANAQLIEDVIRKRNRAFVDSLYLNELALIPFVDEPPIRYPPADVWQALSARRIERYASIDLSGGKESERVIFRALNQKADVAFNAQPLSAVMKFFSDTFGVPIVIDDKALEDENITQDEPITLNLPPVSFRSALKLILEPLQLTYVIQDEVMRITSKQASANVVRVYPVGDLVIGAGQLSMGGGGMMGGMGGMGGGMGGMGGGMMGGMGGGMGGMGGGMGGMGGGMGGMGGMMDVKDQPTKATTVRSPAELVEQLVSSESGDKLLAEAELSKWVVGKMELARKASRANKDNEVREHFQEVIDTVGDAMRKTLPAAWMYTALSTAMEGCEYPSSEIRRVLMSSIDFGGDVDAAIKIGKYLAGQGMKREALSVFRDANHANPMLKEPLEAGLALSLELEDEESIRWACTGILGQAWTDEHLPLMEKALLAASASFIRMTNAKETMKAYAFEKELKHAQLRDVVVRAVWTGDADIDISVEEPTGTICDKSNTRTLSGGLLLADGSSLDKPSKDGYSETYVCANGYSGQYRILLRKVWGKVSGGKVTVNIVTDYGTKDQRVVQQQVPIDQDAIISVEVKNGHRSEPIFETQLAKVQKQKAATSGAVLAQMAPAGAGAGQSGNGTDSGNAYGRLLSQYGNGGLGNGPFGGGQAGFPFAGRGAVGYRPILTFIRAGTQMSVTGVVSGDRRYVLLAPFPNFTDIIAVDTFNTVSGGTNTGGGGAGGGGGVGGGGGAAGGGGGGGFGGGGAF